MPSSAPSAHTQKPENPDFKTIVVPFGDVDFELEGLAVGLIRNNMLM